MDLIRVFSVIEMYIVNDKWILFLKERLYKKKSRKMLYEQLIKCEDEASFIDVMVFHGFDKDFAKELYALLTNKNDIDSFAENVFLRLHNSSSINICFLEYVCFVLLAYGRYTDVYYLQKKVLDRCNNLSLPSIWKYWGAILNNDSSRQKSMFYTLLKKYKSLGNKQKLYALNKIFRDQDSDFPKAVNDSFAKLINGKRIAIVGPAATAVGWGDIYKNHDVIVFITYKGNSVYSINSSKKILISYYNNEAINNLNESDYAAINKLDYICTKKTCTKKINTNIRTFNLLDGMYYTGIPHMLPNIIFDLSYYSPKTISTFGFNMYMSQQQYRGDYQEKPKTTIQWLEDFALHNIISQYLMLSKMYESNLFIPDEHLKAVLEMGIIDYLKRMEDLYHI